VRLRNEFPMPLTGKLHPDINEVEPAKIGPQQEIRRLSPSGDASRSDAASSISSGLSIVAKIIGRAHTFR